MRALLIVTTVLLVPSAALGQSDPGLPGPFSVSTRAYGLAATDDLAFQPPAFAGIGAEVEVRARVYHPTNLAAGPFPIIFILPPRTDLTCFRAAPVAASTGWPCPAGQQPMPTFEGFAAIGELLASHGYIVVSVSNNGIVAQDGTDGVQARAELLQHHMELWSLFNTIGSVFLPGDFGQIGFAFVGRVDLGRVGTVGHSRGGEGAVAHALYNQAQGAPFGVRAVLTLGATNRRDDPNQPRLVLNNVPLAVVLPYCDADVRDLQSVHYFDDALYNVAGDRARKHTLLMMGANHFYFNGVVGAPTFPGAGDEWDKRQNPSDPHCGGAMPSRLSLAQQQRAAAVYASAFFRTYIGHEWAFLPVLDGAAPMPAPIPASSLAAHHEPDHPLMRRDINRIKTASDLTGTNILGGQVRTGGFVAPPLLCGGGAGATTPNPEYCLDPLTTGVAFRQMPHSRSDGSNQGGLTQVLLTWNNPAAFFENALPAGSRDVRRFEFLQFRAAVDFTNANNIAGPIDFSVVLQDCSGASDEQLVSTHSSALSFPARHPPTCRGSSTARSTFHSTRTGRQPRQRMLRPHGVRPAPGRGVAQRSRVLEPVRCKRGAQRAVRRRDDDSVVRAGGPQRHLPDPRAPRPAELQGHVPVRAR